MQSRRREGRGSVRPTASTQNRPARDQGVRMCNVRAASKRETNVRRLRHGDGSVLLCGACWLTMRRRCCRRWPLCPWRLQWRPCRWNVVQYAVSRVVVFGVVRGLNAPVRARRMVGCGSRKVLFCALTAIGRCPTPAPHCPPPSPRARSRARSYRFATSLRTGTGASITAPAVAFAAWVGQRTTSIAQPVWAASRRRSGPVTRPASPTQ